MHGARSVAHGHAHAARWEGGHDVGASATGCVPPWPLHGHWRPSSRGARPQPAACRLPHSAEGCSPDTSDGRRASVRGVQECHPHAGGGRTAVRTFEPQRERACW